MLPRPLLVLILLASSLFAAPGLAQVQIQESTVRIHVSGSVQKPGVYTLPRGARGIDAIQAAGGIVKGAVLSEVNLAGLLEDGQHLQVPNAQQLKRDAPPQAPRASSARRSASLSPKRPGGRLSLNAASPEELDSLPGIGRTLAEEIVRYRQAKGRFRSLDELKEVPGIGERRFERLAPLLTL